MSRTTASRFIVIYLLYSFIHQYLIPFIPTGQLRYYHAQETRWRCDPVSGDAARSLRQLCYDETPDDASEQAVVPIRQCGLQLDEYVWSPSEFPFADAEDALAASSRTTLWRKSSDHKKFSISADTLEYNCHTKRLSLRHAIACAATFRKVSIRSTSISARH